MTQHTTGTRDEWLAARLELLKQEKELTRRGDEVAKRRQELPWVHIDEDYRFDTDDGSASLADLFRGRSQLLIYHFMFGPDYTAGCPSCSMIADAFNGSVVHLANHDVMLWAVSLAPLPKLQAYKRRMGWTFPWASSFGGDFNFDFNASFTGDQLRDGADYNFRRDDPGMNIGRAGATDSGDAAFAAMTGTDVATYMRERPGMSAFALEDGIVYHTYSTFARGVDPFFGVYHWLDRAPQGRNEPGPWFRRHDEYDTAGCAGPLGPVDTPRGTLHTGAIMNEESKKGAIMNEDSKNGRLSTADGTDTPALPAVVDRATWQAELDVLRAREKSHTREGDAIAAARRRLPMVEVDPAIPLIGPQGPITLLEAFEGRRQLIAYYFMWHPGRPAAEQCEGCTWCTTQVAELSYLHSRDLTFAVFCQGPYEESIRYRDFMGWDMPWYSAQASLDALLVGRHIGMMHLVCYLRDGDRVFETYWTTRRGVEAMDYSYALMDLTVYGRQESWEDSPLGWPQQLDGDTRTNGRPIAQWSRLEAGRSDDLGTARR